MKKIINIKRIKKILIGLTFIFSVLLITDGCAPSKKRHNTVLRNLMLLDQKDLHINKQYTKNKITKKRERALRKAKRQAKRKKK